MSVYSAVYADTEVLELVVQGVAIMRRVRDGALNATQLLKLAGLDKPKRAKALDQLSQYEKIQGGYGKFQGTWVPYQVGTLLAHQYKIYELLVPLLEFDLSRRPPSKEAANANPAPQTPLEPVSDSHPAFEHSRQLVIELFLTGEVPSMDVLSSKLSNIEMDVPIDDSGHTALHWAAALGSIDLVKSLVTFGAQATRGNYSGETPLVRAVLVTNNADLMMFRDLLEYLSNSIYIRDKQGRSVLHHIVLTGGISGRSQAARYYLETLLEWVVRKNALANFAGLVNCQDANGDTALNIAARLGNRSLSRQLMEVGSDAYIGNRAGLRPVDFIELEDADITRGPQVTRVTTTNGPSAGERRLKIQEQIQNTLKTLDASFEHELEQRDVQLQEAHKQLREANEEQESHRAQISRINALSNSWAGVQRTFSSLDAAINEEDTKFCASERAEGREPVGLHADIDPDAPFANDCVPQAALEARIRAYRTNNAHLEDLKSALNRTSTDLEAKFRHVVSLCTGVDENQVESLLDGLVQAVESDSRNVDMTRIASFLRRVS